MFSLIMQLNPCQLLPSPRNKARCADSLQQLQGFGERGRTTHRRKVDWRRQLDVELLCHPGTKAARQSSLKNAPPFTPAPTSRLRTLLRASVPASAFTRATPSPFIILAENGKSIPLYQRDCTRICYVSSPTEYH